MFWNNKGKRNGNMFLWGLAAGVVGVIYIFRMMNKNHFNFLNNMGEKHQDLRSEMGMNNFSKPKNNIPNDKKDELFNTFINGTKDELERKATEMNLQN